MPVASPSFLSRYLSGELAHFFELPPGDTAAALGRRLERPRSELAAALRHEAARLAAPAEALASIARLEQPASRAVVTGQQPGLLLGPAYTLSKAVSAVRLAEELDSEAAPVVPIFWLAAQDHDTEEIDHAWLLDGEERLHRIQLPLPSDVPSGEIPFRGEWLEQLLGDLERTGARSEHLAEAAQLLREAAGSAASYADLFAGLLYRLLGHRGIVVLDPTRPTLAPFFAETLERELQDPLATVRAIGQAGEELRALGIEPQLGRGRGATNLFVQEEEGGLPRRRLLRFDGRTFSTERREYRREELEASIRYEPGRLTPAAGLRPISQDAVLPTACFVVGPGELRYLAQLRGVYSHHRVAMPLAWPRATSVVLEPPASRILERHGLDYRGYASERQQALSRILLERHGHAEAFEQALRRLAEEVEELHRRVQEIDPTLAGSVESARERVERTVEMLRGKAVAALRRNDRITSRQFERLEAQLFPGGVPQERFLSPFSFLLKFGRGPIMACYDTIGSSGEYLLRP